MLSPDYWLVLASPSIQCSIFYSSASILKWYPGYQACQDLSVTSQSCFDAPGLFDGTPFAKKARLESQITGASPKAIKSQTPVSQAGFKWRVAGKGQQLTLLSIEVHAASRGSLLPDPRYDAVHCIFLAAMDDDEVAEDLGFTTRMLLFDETVTSTRDGLANIQASHSINASSRRRYMVPKC